MKMKKLILSILLLVPFLGFSQMEAGDWLRVDTVVMGNDSIVVGSATEGQVLTKYGTRIIPKTLELDSLKNDSIYVENGRVYIMQGNNILESNFIDMGVSSSASPLYATIDTCSVDSTYLKSSYTLTAVEYEKSIDVSSSGTTEFTYLFEGQVNTEHISAGLWEISAYTSIDSEVGVTTFNCTVFIYDSTGVETDLFTATSSELSGTEYTHTIIEVSQSAFSVDSTDRLGFRFFGESTHITTKALGFIIGDGRGAYITTPLTLRHINIREPNEDPEVQHMTSAEKIVLDNTSGTNTGDQDLSNYLIIDSLANYTSLFKQAGTSTIFKGLNTIEFETAYDSDDYVIQLTGRVSDTETAELFITQQDSNQITIYAPITCELNYMATGQVCDCSNTNIIPLEIAEGGYFDFSWNGGGTWYFPDGSTSTAAQPSRTLVDGGIVYLVADNVEGSSSLNANATGSAFTGNISALKKLNYYVSLISTNAVGDIVNFNNISYLISARNTLITGDIVNFINNSYWIDVRNTAVYGDVINLSNLTLLAYFSSTSVNISSSFVFSVQYALFQDCSWSELEVQYLLESLVLGGKSNGTCNVSGTNAGANTAALAAIATLEADGWTITYNTL